MTAETTALLAPTAAPDAPILILFADDSTLFFALRMRDILRSTPGAPEVQMGWAADHNSLSYRQMSDLLPDGPDLVVRDKDFRTLVSDGVVQAILTSRVFRPLGDLLKSKLIKHRPGRACVIAFLGGLDFYPENGYMRRRHCDGVYLFPQSDIPVFQELMLDYDLGWRDVGFGHPSVIAPKAAPDDLEARRDIYFFTQAISPITRLGRQHMLDICVAMARANPDHTVWIKLRHLPHENRGHLHKERFDYPALLEAMPDAPENLKFTACGMDEALSKACLGITCTSTAALDVVREGVPCMVHLDYVDNFSDPLVAPMRALFKDSGLITGLDDLLHMRAQAPDPAWLENMFCPDDLGTRILTTIENFQRRPFQLPPEDPSVPEHANQAGLTG